MNGEEKTITLTNDESQMTKGHVQAALLLIAHGSRHAEANADLFHVADELRRRGDYGVVEASFLELAEPDILTAARKCVEQGARRLILLPYFLSAGVHARDDLRATQAALSRQYPEVDVRLAEPLGRHELLIQLVTLRAYEADGKEDPLLP